MLKSKQNNQTKLFETSKVSKFTFLIFLSVFVVTGLTTLWLLNTNNNSRAFISIVTILVLFSGIALLLMAYSSWHQFNTFCSDINQWASQLIKGDLSSRMATEVQLPSKEFRSLINRISDDYESLSVFEQQRFTRQAEREYERTLSILDERTRMAHELHDSLAQTLATLRIKVRLFDDSMRQSDKINESTIWNELSGLEEIIDTAYAELRSLITHFRAPIDGKGVVRSVERLSERFKLETDIEVFFYHNWELEDLDRDIEVEVIRIIQEALANVKKHAQADNVRILMISTEDGNCSVLVEDDGIGLDQSKLKTENKSDNHIGLSVMRERAERINGEIQYDDDDGEGTLVQLNFEVPTEVSTENLTKIPINNVTLDLSNSN